MLYLICCFTCHMMCFLSLYSFVISVGSFVCPPPPFFFSICFFTGGVVCVMSCDSPPPHRDLPEDLCPVYRPGEWEQLPSERDLNPFSRYEALNPKRPIILDGFESGKGMNYFLWEELEIMCCHGNISLSQCLCRGISLYFLSLICLDRTRTHRG